MHGVKTAGDKTTQSETARYSVPRKMNSNTTFAPAERTPTKLTPTLARQLSWRLQATEDTSLEVSIFARVAHDGNLDMKEGLNSMPKEMLDADVGQMFCHVVDKSFVGIGPA